MKSIKQVRVEQKLDVSRSTLLRLIKRGEFPQPTKIGANNFWLEEEVDAWLAKRFGKEGKQ